MIEVWHAGDKVEREDRFVLAVPGNGEQALTAARLFANGQYDKVAEVETSDLETAWRLTNNIESSWSMEPDSRVKVTAPLHVLDGETYGRRSSMMGDIFVVADVKYVAATFGFTTLP